MVREFLQRLPLLPDRRGGTAVEFALVAPLLIVALFGIIDFGRMMWMASSVEHAAAEAVRYAIVRGADADVPATATDIADYVNSRTAGMNPEDLSVAVNWSPNNWSGSLVSVTVGYRYDFFLANLLALEPIQLEGASTMEIF